MKIICEKAWAKVNLTLDVLGKREDGFHDLKSVMQTVSLCDDIEIIVGTGRPWELVCDQQGIPCDERNLAWKAADVFCRTVGVDPNGLCIRIEKRIPSGAGMGGGSADAAAVLRGLNRHFGEPMTIWQLADLGAQVGSDVPFCVAGGTIMCEGRGEKLRKLPDMPKCILLGCKPEFSVSTPALYKKLDEVGMEIHPDNDAMEASIAAGDIRGIAANLINVFDPVVSREHPEIQRIKDACLSHGALAAQMTGSGSVVFAIMPDMTSAEAGAETLKMKYDTVFIAEPV